MNRENYNNRKVNQQEQDLWAATQEGIPIERARAYIELAQLEGERSNFKQAILLFETALDLIQAEADSNYAPDLLNVLCSIADCYYFLSRYQDEIGVIEKAIVVANEYGIGDLGSLLRAAGRCYYSLNDDQSSMKNHQAALDYPDPDATEDTVATDQLNIGMSLSRLKRFNEAIEKFQIARSIFKKLKQPRMVAICDGELAETYVGLNDPIGIKEYGHLALGTAEMIEDRRRQWWLHYFLAVAMRLQGELEKGISHLDTGRNLALTHGFEEFAYLVKVDQELVKIYLGQGMTQKAEEIERRVKTVADILEAA